MGNNQSGQTKKATWKTPRKRSPQMTVGRKGIPTKSPLTQVQELYYIVVLPRTNTWLLWKTDMSRPSVLNFLLHACGKLKDVGFLSSLVEFKHRIETFLRVCLIFGVNFELWILGDKKWCFFLHFHCWENSPATNFMNLCSQNDQTCQAMCSFNWFSYIHRNCRDASHAALPMLKVENGCDNIVDGLYATHSYSKHV